jgi:hypothetical protein
MRLIKTKNNGYINLDHIVQVIEEQSKYYIFVHMFLNEFRRFEISSKEYDFLIKTTTVSI